MLILALDPGIGNVSSARFFHTHIESTNRSDTRSRRGGGLASSNLMGGRFKVCIREMRECAEMKNSDLCWWRNTEQEHRSTCLALARFYWPLLRFLGLTRTAPPSCYVE